MRRSADSSGAGSSTFFAKSLRPYYPGRPDDSLLKIGVELSPDLDALALIDTKDKLPYLMHINQLEPLQVVVEDLCNRWKLNHADNFALQLTQRSNHYLCEKNRFDLMNGDVLHLALSPDKLSETLVILLEQSVETLVFALPYILARVGDPVFSNTFIEKNGFTVLMQILQKGILNDLPLSQLLSCFHGLVVWTEESWDIVSDELLILIADLVVGRAKFEHPKVLSIAMAILEDLITNASSRAELINKQVPFESLVRHLENSDLNVQLNVVTLMNAMFTKAAHLQRREIAKVLFAKPVRNALKNNILRNDVGPELAHQLHVLQRLMLNTLEEKAFTKVTPSMSVVEELNEFCRMATEKLRAAASPASNRKGFTLSQADMHKLGFKTKQHPIGDFETAPPGLLALECALYFYKTYYNVCFKIILENAHRTDGRECPFIYTGVQLVSVLLDVLHVGELPSEHGSVYYELLFTEEHSFEELFCRCVTLLSRTWKEMRATSFGDVAKVMAVIKEQITRSLNEKPKTFGDFEKLLKHHNYSEISNSWDRERSMKEESSFQTPQIIELKKLMGPQIDALLAYNRLALMKKGQVFAKYCRGAKGSREKGKFWFWKLCDSEKFFLYSDSNEKNRIFNEDVEWKLPVGEIGRVILRGDCTHIKEIKGKKPGDVLSFTLALVGDTALKNSYNFVAPDSLTFDVWTDGLLTLLNEQMISARYKQERDLWLNMELRLRLLQLEGVDVPNESSAIPEPPENCDCAI